MSNLIFEFNFETSLFDDFYDIIYFKINKHAINVYIQFQ